MPTARFVVVSAPLEERVAASLASTRAQERPGWLRSGCASAWTRRFSARTLAIGTKEALEHVSRPGGLPFVLFMLLVAVLAVRELLLRVETKRILKVHKLNVSVRPPEPPHQHED